MLVMSTISCFDYYFFPANEENVELWWLKYFIFDSQTVRLAFTHHALQMVHSVFYFQTYCTHNPCMCLVPLLKS